MDCPSLATIAVAPEAAIRAVVAALAAPLPMQGSVGAGRRQPTDQPTDADFRKE